MSKRGYELAKELGMSSRDVLSALASLGVVAKSHSSTVDDDLVSKLKEAAVKGSQTLQKPVPPARPARQRRPAARPAGERPSAERTAPPTPPPAPPARKRVPAAVPAAAAPAAPAATPQPEAPAAMQETPGKTIS